ncbi:tripartite tricarboxylate transporter substrate binding protein [Xylophilus sp. Kf1]|nr:tripartite tricarboxylate transporter substrate binding protein [Xylophilus sp. Kf1]
MTQLNSKNRRQFLLGSCRLTAVAAAAAAGLPAMAQDTRWPVRAIRVVVPFPAGSITDTVARILSDGLSKSLGQPVVIDNKPGANGAIGVSEVARAAPDGYTLLVTNSSSITINPQIYKNITYTAADLAPVCAVMEAPFILVVNPEWAQKNQVATVRDLVQFAQKNPGRLNYGTAGAGNIGHLAYAMLSNNAGVKTTHVPYKSASQAQVAIMAGEIESAFDTFAAIPQIQAGKLKPLAVTSAERIAQLPDVPTMAQAGFADMNIIFWLGMLAPRGTPAAIVDRIYANAKTALDQPAARTSLATQGNVVMLDPAAFSRRIAAEIPAMGAVVRRENISLD